MPPAVPVHPTIMHKSHAPVINPYDKLTQNQFNSYVSNIQSKIQLALNPPSPEPRHVSRSIAEISQSTIASPAPSPAPLSKRSSLEPRAPSKVYTPLGAGTPNEPYELSDDDEGEDDAQPQAKPLLSSGSEADAESDIEQEPVSLSAIPEGTEDGDGKEEELGTDEAYYSGYENENDPQEVEWDYSGEDASEDEEASGVEEEEEEEEDVFIGKGKGRHPAEGPGLSALLNGSGARRAGRAAGTPERVGHSSRALDDSFEEGVGRMPVLGVTSTPFISRLRSGSARSQEDSDDEDPGSPAWEVSQGMSMPVVATYPEDESEVDSAEESDQEDKGPGAARDDAIEVLDSDEEEEVAATPKGIEVDEIATSPAPSNDPERLHDNTEFDELQFDDSAAYPDEGQEPDSLLDDTMDRDDSMSLQVLTDGIPPGPSSLFSASSIAVTREPSQSKDDEEIDHSADTVHAPDYSVDQPDINTAATDGEREFDQSSMQKSLDYSDFVGERSLLAQQDTSITQAEQQLHEVTVYELENGSRYYDFDGVRHFLSPEGQVYETVVIPPPRPTIQQPPDLTMIEEVTEYDITRKMNGIDEDEDEGAKFDFLKEFDDTFSSVGEPILRYPDGDSSIALGIDDIPQRPDAALGFRSENIPGADLSDFLSDSIVLGDDLTTERDTNQHYGTLNRLGPKSSFVSATGTITESMTGRNADDLVSEDDIVSASEAGGEGDADESQDSILDDDDDDDGGDTTRELDSRVLDREDLVTPVPPSKADESGMESQLQLDEKGVADALAAVAQLAEEASFESFMNAGGVEAPNINDPMFESAANLDNLLNEVSSMSAEEEDMLARSFNMADALQNATIPLDELSTFDNLSTQIGETSVESSIPGEFIPVPFIASEDVPEKLASDVLAEVFEGVEPISMSSVTGTRTTTPSGEPEPFAQTEEIEVSPRSPTPQQQLLPLTESGNQDPSLRRTPPTPTLSAGQSLTAPELSIATSISETSVAQPDVSVYEGSPTSSTHREDTIQIVPPTQSDTTELPDPNLPPSPTHLSMPAVPTAPDSSEIPGEVSPSVVVEPPTPDARSEVEVAETNTTAKPEEAEVLAKASIPLNGKQLGEERTPATVEKGEVNEEVDVVGPLPQEIGTPSRRSRTLSPSARSSAGQSSESRATPSPDEKMRTGEKRKRLEDLPSPTSTPLRLSVKSPARGNEEVRSPSSIASVSPDTPTPRQTRSLFKRNPTTKPVSTASGTSSRKTSGSDSAPAPWPMRRRTHRHVLTSQPALSSPGQPKANTSTGSPIPRSGCRFHKVVIPVTDKEDDNIEFIIPACALGGSKVLQEHNAEDRGLSTAEDENAMVTDFSDVELNIVDKLKALVGTSLFDEGVCGYLSSSPAKASHPAPNRLKGSMRGSVSDFKFEPNPENESKTVPTETRPKPRSRPSIRHDDRLFKPPAEDSESDDVTEAEPTRKRPKHKKRDTIGSMSSVKFPSLGQDSPEKPAPQQPEGRVPISRRMKRARRPADAQPYKPDPTQEESSQDDETNGSPRKRTKHRATSVIRRIDSNSPTQEPKRIQDEVENPFKPKHELNRALSPEATGSDVREKSVPPALDSTPDPVEQKDLERHVELGDRPGEVVTEEGEEIAAEQLPEPAPAKVAAYVDRNAPSEIGKKESNAAGENALGTKNNGKKGWSKFLRF